MPTNIRRPPRNWLGPPALNVGSVVLAVPQPETAAQLGRLLRRGGWEVQVAFSADEARRLLREGEPTAAVLAVDLPDESGWLVCAKLQWSNPEVPVALLGPVSSRNRRFAEFVGAKALLPHPEAVADWLRKQ